MVICTFRAVIAQDSLINNFKGTWVVESNLASPREHLIKFYNSRLELIHQEKLANKRLNYQRKHIRKALDKKLALVLYKERDTQAATMPVAFKTANK